MQELEIENNWVGRAVSDLTLDKLILAEATKENLYLGRYQGACRIGGSARSSAADRKMIRYCSNHPADAALLQPIALKGQIKATTNLPSGRSTKRIMIRPAAVNPPSWCRRNRFSPP
ncbi:hypothetical protein IVB15_30250 [Bradyrhizobium sp. 182]|uniref:hypothetical protein n=1 Tax=unclassified Bradyrhizobium TaxID=2631580 RepID=UPI001FFAF0DF|nr:MULTISPECIES: hypothetical protein [unclassified Bradyrhizobium]MCK1424825.1 hypothetical protein [Bradyrhizobium sp. CW12]MCK1531855.1 hypothetical protein [Bradyrhizobium sp. 182]MCK1646506.1 hypothetical protein [Bradyrhizobium sp. 154]